MDSNFDGVSDADSATAAYYIQVTQLFFCAMYAVALWDWIISFKRERILVWGRPFSLVTVLYCGCRYWVVISTPVVLWLTLNESHTTNDCAVLYRIPPIISLLNQVFSEGILLIRTQAFVADKRVLPVFSVLLLAIVSYQLYVIITQMTFLLDLVPPLDKGPCLPSSNDEGGIHLMAWFLGPLVFDSALTALTIWKAVQNRVKWGMDGKLWRNFLREGVCYYVFISIGNIVNCRFNVQMNMSMRDLAIPLSIILPDVLACRMLLDLRETSQKLHITHSISSPASRPFPSLDFIVHDDGVDKPEPDKYTPRPAVLRDLITTRRSRREVKRVLELP